MKNNFSFFKVYHLNVILELLYLMKGFHFWQSNFKPIIISISIGNSEMDFLRCSTKLEQPTLTLNPVRAGVLSDLIFKRGEEVGLK